MFSIQTNFKISLNVENFEKALNTRLVIAGQNITNLAKERAPKDTGALERSINPKIDGLKLVVSAETEYALEQELNEEYNHPRKGQAHYLMSSLAENISPFIDSLGEVVKDLK